jgi:hypothetical protein
MGIRDWPFSIFNLGKNITDDKTDNSHMTGIKERFFIKMLPTLPCSVLKLSTGTQYPRTYFISVLN